MKIPPAWWTLDERAIGVFRILLSALTLFDCARRFTTIDLYYSEAGVFPLSALYLYRAEGWVSLLSSFRAVELVQAFFLVEMAALLLVFQGRFSQGAKWVAWLFQLSIISRNPVVLNGADYILCAWWMWALFLPLDVKFQISWGRWTSAVPSRANSASRLVRSPVASVVLVQLSLIYFFNAIHKDGQTWREGTSTWFFLWQQRQVTGFGLLLRDHAPLWLFRLTTWSTLVIEWLAPLLLLTPQGVRLARPLAVVLLLGLHLGIMATADLALFSPTLMVTYPLLLRPVHYDWLARQARRAFAGVRKGPPVEQQAEHSVVSESAPLSVLPEDVAPPPHPRDAHFGKWALAGAIFFVVLWENGLRNPAVSRRVELPVMPLALRESLQALKLQQFWHMFAPSAPTVDGRLVIEFQLKDGTYVDLETGGRVPPGPNNPRVHRPNTYWERYTNALSYGVYAPQRRAFVTWLRNRGEALPVDELSEDVHARLLKGGHLKPEDETTSADAISAYWLYTGSPRFGDRHPRLTSCHFDLFYSPPQRSTQLRQRRAELNPGERCPWLR